MIHCTKYPILPLLFHYFAKHLLCAMDQILMTIALLANLLPVQGILHPLFNGTNMNYCRLIEQATLDLL